MPGEKMLMFLGAKDGSGVPGVVYLGIFGVFHLGVTSVVALWGSHKCFALDYRCC